MIESWKCNIFEAPSRDWDLVLQDLVLDDSQDQIDLLSAQTIVLDHMVSTSSKQIGPNTKKNETSKFGPIFISAPLTDLTQGKVENMRVATVQVFAQPLIRVVDIYQALDARAAGIDASLAADLMLRPWPRTPDPACALPTRPYPSSIVDIKHLQTAEWSVQHANKHARLELSRPMSSHELVWLASKKKSAFPWISLLEMRTWSEHDRQNMHRKTVQDCARACKAPWFLLVQMINHDWFILASKRLKHYYGLPRLSMKWHEWAWFDMKTWNIWNLLHCTES